MRCVTPTLLALSALLLLTTGALAQQLDVPIVPTPEGPGNSGDHANDQATVEHSELRHGAWTQQEQARRGIDSGAENAAAKGGSKTGGSTTSTGISYHSGPIMTAPINVYCIFYGSWTQGDPNSVGIIQDFLNGIAASSWWTTIEQTYVNAAKTPVSGTVAVKGTAYVPLTGNVASAGSVLTGTSDTQIIANIVQKTVNTGVLGALDPNGIYFVLTSPEVKLYTSSTNGFCKNYCGWHSKYTVSSSPTPIKFAFVGNPATQCMSGCGSQSVGPNGNAGVDSMVSVVGHELAEAASDPLLNAWYDSKGNENADKCAWTFGTTSTAANGAQYNIAFGTRQYLLQRNWVNAGIGGCYMHYP